MNEEAVVCICLRKINRIETIANKGVQKSKKFNFEEHIDLFDKRIKNQKGIKVPFKGVNANHFFSNKENELIPILNSYINKEIAIF